MTDVEITKLVHGGQGLGELPSGKKVFVWNALPGERVRVRIIKKKRDYAEAIAEEIVRPSPLRQAPREPAFLSTSPWQIMPLSAENEYKKGLVQELFNQAHIHLPDFDVTYDNREWQYRNKMEYSFWGDDEGLHLALHLRGSHYKLRLSGSLLAMPAVDEAARSIVRVLESAGVRASDLKTVMVRCSQAGQCVAALFVKTESFPKIDLPDHVQGLRVYYSTPKSPASVPTQLLYETGSGHVADSLLGKEFLYDSESFFQVNVPVFEQALARIRQQLSSTEALVDMYAGVGSIGLSVAEKRVSLVEVHPATAAMARTNAAKSGLQATVVETSTEKATEQIAGDAPVIVDPPRSGLHSKVIDVITAVRPPQLVYLSCNPATQARDLARLQSDYSVAYFEAFNFFPHTPHIETLAVLTRK